ncbi:hypothetical protein [Pedobacter roseus]|uniref:Uncharacterized protein n=1 Tax=Pedobacter roseus TaxID=336820 RepID=A0A7G9QHU7_9SPHI|nr:hypothetical protein [Pedobacter roseus]QNN42922.1 hypothetical protein H9L23_02105 [Pedobacter roseus]
MYTHIRVYISEKLQRNLHSGSPKSIKEDKKKAEDKSGSSETKADFESPVDDPA